jgi:hypothetical protein
MLQPQLFLKYVVDDLGSVGGSTGARLIRASDALSYVVKDDTVDVPQLRASEFFWLSVARAVGLPAPIPEVIEDRTINRTLVATRREQNRIGKSDAETLLELLTGKVHNGGQHLSRVLAFDLFCANWDRHPGNYLVIDEGGAKVVFAIDFSHVVLNPNRCLPDRDPATEIMTATRQYFPRVVQPYGHDQAAAAETLNSLAALPDGQIDGILRSIPDDWIRVDERQEMADWWANGERARRLAAISNELGNGTYF